MDTFSQAAKLVKSADPSVLPYTRAFEPLVRYLLLQVNIDVEEDLKQELDLAIVEKPDFDIKPDPVYTARSIQVSEGVHQNTAEQQEYKDFLKD